MDLTARFLNLPAEAGQPNKVNTSSEDPPEVDPDVVRVDTVKQAQTRLPADEILTLVETYRAGATVAQLTRDYGINRTTVLEHLERHGVPRRPHVRKLTNGQVAEAAELYQQGWSYSRLGKKYFVNAETIRKELAKIGVKSRPKGIGC